MCSIPCLYYQYQCINWLVLLATHPDFCQLDLPVPYNNGTAVRVIQASTTSCGGCQMHEAAFEFNWYTEILTHTAATVIFAIDNSTNITKTKAIEAGTLPIPYSLGFNLRSTISGSLFSTIVGGITYTL